MITIEPRPPLSVPDHKKEFVTAQLDVDFHIQVPRDFSREEQKEIFIEHLRALNNCAGILGLTMKINNLPDGWQGVKR